MLDTEREAGWGFRDWACIFVAASSALHADIGMLAVVPYGWLGSCVAPRFSKCQQVHYANPTDRPSFDLSRNQGKAAAAAAAASGIPLTIGRPVVKSAKEVAKAAVPVPGTRARSGAAIIGRPVATQATPPTKVAKVPGVGDSPQASTQLQQQQSIPGQPPQAMAAGTRIGGSGPQTPSRTIQVRVVYLFCV